MLPEIIRKPAPLPTAEEKMWDQLSRYLDGALLRPPSYRDELRAPMRALLARAKNRPLNEIEQIVAAEMVESRPADLIRVALDTWLGFPVDRIHDKWAPIGVPVVLDSGLIVAPVWHGHATGSEEASAEIPEVPRELIQPGDIIVRHGSTHLAGTALLRPFPRESEEEFARWLKYWVNRSLTDLQEAALRFHTRDWTVLWERVD